MDKSHLVDHNDWTIKAGLIVSSIAVIIAFWNFLMVSENHFDPVKFELELASRQQGVNKYNEYIMIARARTIKGGCSSIYHDKDVKLELVKEDASNKI